MESKKTKNLKSNFRTKETKELTETQKPELLNFCRPNCQVCTSGHLEYIQKSRRDGMKLVELSNHLKNEFDLNLSKDVLWLHFKNYNKKLRVASAEKLLKDFNEKIETTHKHQKATLFLINRSFQNICEHLESGSLILGVDDFEKLVKLYYNILRDPDRKPEDDSIIAIFQRAAKKHGFPLEQGVLIKHSKSEPVNN